MKKFLSSIFCVLLSIAVFADTVSESEALAIASNFMNAPTTNSAGHHVARAPRKFVRAHQSITENQQFYVFINTMGDGYIIVSADDIARPILGYSESGSLDLDNIPDNLRWWLSEYNREIEWAKKNGYTPTPEVIEEWENCRRSAMAPADVVVGPLLTTTWNQNAPYNNLCPQYSGITRAATGCVATATAQIMNYHQWPVSGTGSKSYTTITRQFDLSANFANVQYEWRNMRDNYSGTYSIAQANAVAELMFQVGVASEMDYATDESGQSGTSNANAAYGLTHYFGYSKEIHMVRRSEYEDYSWVMILMNQLDNNMPVLYGGGEEGSGHSFVCDGYNSNYYFHFNWGWGGVANNYYSISALIPSATGMGAGSNHNYTSNQHAILNIKPDTVAPGYNLQLFSEIFSLGDTIHRGDTLIYPGFIMNVGKKPFNGRIYLVATKVDGSDVYLLDSLENAVFPSFNLIDCIVEQDQVSLSMGISALYYGTYNLNIPIGNYYLSYMYEDTINNIVGIVGSDYHINAIALHVYGPEDLSSGKYVIYADADNPWFISSNLTSTSTKRFVADTIAGRSDLFYINADPAFVWNVTKNADGTYVFESNGKYMSWTSGNSGAMSTTPKNLDVTFDSDSYGYVVSFKASETETRTLSYNSANGSQYFAFYGNTNQNHILYFVEAFEVDTTVVRAKIPSNWGNTIRAWVWYDGEDGEWATPTLEDGWYVYRGLGDYNIIFVNGTTWNGDNNQTVDIAVHGDMCIMVGSNTSGKRTYGEIECNPEPIVPDCKTLPFSESFASNQGDFTIENVALDGLNYVWTFASSYGMKASAYVSSVNHPTESWLISPCMEFPEDATINLTFDHVYRYTTTPTTDLTLLVSEDYVGGAPSNATWTPVAIPTYSSGSNWTFVNAGSIDLSAYAGKYVTLAFRYTSSSAAAATWEIKNVSVTASGVTTNLNTDFDSRNATKCILDGRLVIIRNGRKFSATGMKIE